MAATLSFFMAPEDEVSFFRSLEQYQMEIYPEVSEPGYQPMIASAESAKRLDFEACYLALPSAGEITARQIKRGPHSGMLEIDELRSPVIHFERSLMVDGELRSGRLWSELEVLGDRQHLLTKPDLLRQVFEKIRGHFKKHYRPSRPRGFFIGGAAARKVNQGLCLREAGRKGEVVTLS